MPETRIDLPQGTLDLLILRSLSLGPRLGWAISERIQEGSPSGSGDQLAHEPTPTFIGSGTM